MAGIDFIHQNGVDYEIVPEIAPLFKTTVAYHTGDHVIYDAKWYTFKANKAAGAWDVTKVNGPFEVADQLTNLKEDLKSALDGILTSEVLSKVWTQGNINSSTGVNSGTASNRIRLYLYQYVDAKMDVTVPSGLKVFVYKYASPETAGFIGADGFGWHSENFSVESGVYYRFVAAYTDDSDITPDAGANIVLTNYVYTDTTFTKEGKAADSKAVGVAFASTIKHKRLLTSIDDIDTIFDTGTYRWVSTSVPINSPTQAAGTLLVAGSSPYLSHFVIAASSTIFARYHNSTEWGGWNEIKNEQRFAYRGLLTKEANFNDLTMMGCYQSVSVEKDLVSVLNRPSRMDGVLIVLPADNASRMIQIYINTLNISYQRFRKNDIWSNWENSNASTVQSVYSWGISNALANANNVMSIKWTPTANMPRTYKNMVPSDPTDFFSIQEYTGIPYSSVRDQDKSVGMDVSFKTFMTAVRDPRSVLYTRRSTVSNSATYYGTVCSGLVNVGMGINLDLTNYYLSESDMFETIPMIALNIGDMIWITGHCALISNITKDDYGRIKTVTVIEEWRPLPRTVKYSSWDNFITAREGYIARRFKNIDGVIYNNIPYVQNFDESSETISYPDVQTEYGDGAVFKVGEDVSIHVLDASDYTRIIVSRDGTQIRTITNIDDFILSNVEAGYYTITADGGENISTSDFYVVDCNGSFDTTTGEVTFSSINAIPVLVNVYNLPSDRKIVCKPIILSDADREAGSINVLDYMDSEYQYAKVTFMTPYGTAVWYSESHQKWIPIT